jgi:hypothetical protein
MLNIGRGRRREHPNDTSEGGSRSLRSLRVLRNFRLCMLTPKGTPKGSSDLGHYGCCATSGCACAHPMEPEGGQVTFGSHVTTTKKKAREKAGHAQKLLPVRVTFGQGLFRSRDFVTSGQKALLWWIWRNFRTSFRTMTNVTSGHMTDVTSGHVTSGHAQWSDPPQIWLELSLYTTEMHEFNHEILMIWSWKQLTAIAFRTWHWHYTSPGEQFPHKKTIIE